MQSKSAMQTKQELTRLDLGDISVPRSSVHLLDKIGEGFYGTTYRARTAVGLIAAKLLKGLGRNPEGVNKFLQEAARMKNLRHRNVISIIGVVKDPTDPIILLPLMGKGDLKEALRRDRFEPGDLANLCLQASRGMEYLASLKYIHRDLAARNCLLDDNYELKVSDFGLAHKCNLPKLEGQCYYQIQSHGMPLPIRWMAVESIITGTFTLETDVWSFGVVMWEIYNRRDMPYSDIDDKDLLRHLESGKRLQAPPGMPPELKSIMEQCWNKEPSLRKSFRDKATGIQNFTMGSGSKLQRALTARVRPY